MDTSTPQNNPIQSSTDHNGAQPITNQSGSGQTPPKSTDEKSTLKKQKSGAMLLFSLIFLLLLGGLAFVSYQLFLKDTQLTSIKQEQQKAMQANNITIPKDAVQIAGCLPYMGEHWVETQNIPRGPYYVTYKGKMIAIEYMFKPDEIPGQTIATASPSGLFQYMQEHKLSYGDLFKPDFPFDLTGLNVKFMQMTWTPPHAGFLTPHFDVHFYLVDKEEVNTICPNAKPEEGQSPQIEQQLKKYNIPFVPLEQPSTQSSGSTTGTPTDNTSTTTKK